MSYFPIVNFPFLSSSVLSYFPIVNFPFLSSSVPVLTHVQCTYENKHRYEELNIPSNFISNAHDQLITN
jgi:hypothetical protein